MKNKSASHLVLTGLFVVLLSAICDSPALAQTSWTGAALDGNWFTDSNWTNHTPTQGNDALINTNYGGPPMIANGAYGQARTVHLGVNQEDSGGLVVTSLGLIVWGDSQNIPGDVVVGERGSGTLAISNAGVNCQRGFVAALQNPTRPNSNGTVKVGPTGVWGLEFNRNGSNGAAGLFIGCDDAGNPGGTGLVDLGGFIVVQNDESTPVDAPVKVGPSGTLTGDHGELCLSGADEGSATVDVHGTFKPIGHGTDAVLAIVGNLTLESDATTVFNVRSVSDYDWVNVAFYNCYLNGPQHGGTARLGGRVVITAIGNNYTPGTTLPLVQTEVLRDGFFSSESITFPPQTQCFKPQITYDAHNAYLYLKPCRQ